MKQIFFILTVVFFSVKVYGQSDDLTKYQDTVFIKYNKDWSDDKINYVTDTIIFETGIVLTPYKLDDFFQEVCY